ncbi:MAG: ornithine carbamoyltransferase [Oscillospiraceae bacterium]|nr:ornithine carbamoyltransferase [Oscillospiraceae bacterium]
MSVDLKGRSFLTLMDYTPEEIRYLLELAAALKAEKKAGIRKKRLEGKNIVLLFEKTSTRTRCAFEVAAMDEGAGVTYLDSKSSQMGKKESLPDTARVLGRFFDGIEYRGYSQSVVEQLAKYSGVPVFNGLTDTDHPTQALADVLTMTENIKKPLDRCRLVFCGDTRNNIAYCLMYICAKLGIHFVGCGPEELAPAEEAVRRCAGAAKESGAVIEHISDPYKAVEGADVLYTDIWASMGEEELIPQRVKLLTPYRVTERLFEATGNPECIFLHCLPSFHDFETVMAAEQMKLGYDIREVENEVFFSPRSKVFDEAENRLHTIKAVLVALLGDEK